MFIITIFSGLLDSGEAQLTSTNEV